MEKAKELLTRYFYAIKRKLSLKSRNDLIREIESLTEADWTFKELPEIPQKKEEVKLREAVAGLFFTLLVLILLNGMVYGSLNERIMSGTGTCSLVPIINIPSLHRYAPLWNISLFPGLILQMILIKTGRYERCSRLIELAASFFDITILFIMIKGPMLIVPGALTAAFNPTAGSFSG